MACGMACGMTYYGDEIYAEWLKEIDQTEKCAFFWRHYYLQKQLLFLMLPLLRALLRWPMKKPWRPQRFYLPFFSRAAWQHWHYITKVGHWRKDVLEGRSRFCFNFLQICTINFPGFLTFICLWNRVRRWNAWSRMLSFLFLWKNESFSLRNWPWRNSTLFSSRRIALFWSNQGSIISSTFSTLWSRKVHF